jgi:hypothetical protein
MRLFPVLLKLIATVSAVTVTWNPVPPCQSPFPNSAVSETWCSNQIDENVTSGVIIAEYGLPASETLITVATNSSIWYSEALFLLGGGFYDIFLYLTQANVISNARTVPFIIRPLNPLASPPNFWLTSLLISTANYPNPDKIPEPNSTSLGQPRLELVGAHTFATLDFNFSNPTGDRFQEPPYFTYFLKCDEDLQNGLPNGWHVIPSLWTPSWLIYNGQNYNGTWTCRCLAEVERDPEANVSSNDLRQSIPKSPLQKFQSSLSTITSSSLSKPASVVSSKSSGAPPICGVLLEFETYAWGAWLPPHAPSKAIPDINGGTFGLSAIDVDSGTVFMGTEADGPFFTIRLAAIDIATGASRTIGNNWPYPPPGFSGVNGLFFSLNFDKGFGLIVGMTEISKYGPIPPYADEPGLPVGWTVISSVDSITAASTALTTDLTPILTQYPPIVHGISALDTNRGMLWLVAAPNQPPLMQIAKRVPRHRHHFYKHDVRAATLSSMETVILGIELSNPPKEPSPLVLPTADGFTVCAIAYSSAVDAVIALEFNSSGTTPSEGFNLTNGDIRVYPVNGSASSVIGVIPSGVVNPGFGQVEVSEDGRYVYFAAMQGTNAFESPALITVDTVDGTFDLALAAPDGTYDVLTLARCV